MDASLEGLPTELLGLIAECCCALNDDRLTLLNLRLASRTIESAVRGSWIGAYFTHRNVDIDKSALETLCEVSDISEFAREVKVLRIRCKDDLKYHRNPDSTGAEEPLGEYVHLCRMMWQAFRNFQNVKTIEFLPTIDGVNDQCTEKGDAVLDYGMTFSYVLVAAQQSGLRPRCIRRAGLEYHPCDAEFRMSAAVDLSTLSECCSDLRLFETKISLEAPWDEIPALAKQFAFGLNRLASLASLSLDFNSSSHWGPRAIFIRELAQHVYLPYLEIIDLGSASWFLSEMTAFLAKHVNTMTHLRLKCLDIFESDIIPPINAMLEKLQESPGLEYLDITRFEIHGSDGHVIFPRVNRVVDDEFENLDGYVMVDLREGVRFSGVQEVHQGLEDMLSHIIIGPRRS